MYKYSDLIRLCRKLWSSWTLTIARLATFSLLLNSLFIQLSAPESEVAYAMVKPLGNTKSEKTGSILSLIGDIECLSLSTTISILSFLLNKLDACIRWIKSRHPILSGFAPAEQ